MITISAPKDELERFKQTHDFCHFDEYANGNCEGNGTCTDCEYKKIEFIITDEV